ncbi:hypothetical protein EUGRSUZ_J00723 [Eucalyptus grandis]|uniref:Uncharacterized protein n=2 Tax=Eucalyptus grandis TaxID=71139 RepID=A0ACC3J2S5_EUCGR|nr:hypothetical protein EUGRSUZ_J00723 [Eucalyptus grandis]
MHGGSILGILYFFAHSPLSSIAHTSMLSSRKRLTSPGAPQRSTADSERSREDLVVHHDRGHSMPRVGSESSRIWRPLAACMAAKRGSSMVSRHSLRTGLNLRSGIVGR